MRTYKRKLAALLICILLLSLYGCGKGADINTQQPAQSQVTDQSENALTSQTTESEEDSQTETLESETQTTETQTTETQTPEVDKTPENGSGQQSKPDTGTKPNTNGSTDYVPPTGDEQLAATFFECLGKYRSYIGEEKSRIACDAAIKLVKDIMGKYTSEIDREIALHDYILNICDYDTASLSTGLTREGQTIYGVLIEKKAVCGGYCNTFMICMNMMGMECHTLIAGDHGWNQVKIEGDWYEVDCTWDDNIGSYAFFNLTSEQMDAADHAKYHAQRTRTCNGSKYGMEYIYQRGATQAFQKFKAECADVYFDTTSEVTSYLNNQEAKGYNEINFYVTPELYKTLASESGISVWTENNYKDEYCSYYAEYYVTTWNGYELKEVVMVYVNYTSISKYVGQSKYIASTQELKDYLESAKTQGLRGVKFYIKPEAYVEQPNWAIYGGGSLGNMNNLCIYELWYYEGDDPWEYWEQQGWIG